MYTQFYGSSYLYLFYRRFIITIDIHIRYYTSTSSIAAYKINDVPTTSASINCITVLYLERYKPVTSMSFTCTYDIDIILTLGRLRR